MNQVIIAKFGGSTIGVDGISIPIIIQRINSISKDAKVVAVFSAPLTVIELSLIHISEPTRPY